MSPKNLNLSKGMQTCLSFANSFSCGVFLAMCLINLIPSSNSTWRKILTKNINESANHIQLNDQNSEHNTHYPTHMFPWSEFITLLWFTIIFIIEVLEGGREGEEYSITINRKNQTGI